MRSDNVVHLRPREDEPRPLHACESCGGQWWNLPVNLDDDGKVVGWARIVECRDCGRKDEL